MKSALCALPRLGLHLVVILLFPVVSQSAPAIRANQFGYLPEDPKFAVVASSEVISDLAFRVVDSQDRIVFRGYLSPDKGIYTAFAHHYIAEFSALRKTGMMRLIVGSEVSLPFAVEHNLYRALPDSVLRFFSVQRCGNTSPFLHAPCHLSDAISIKSDNDKLPGADLTGGWHDAGDYIKFTLTTAYSTHLLLLTYQLFPELYKRWLFAGLPTPVIEAKVGLDWLMKAHLAPDRLINQVQDLSDHSVGWRLPENDPLAEKRSGLEYSSKAIAASAAAALALGADVFAKLGERKYADNCLAHASQLFAMAQSSKLPDTEAKPDSHYYDNDPRDNIALAAAELYLTTGENRYLIISKQLIDTLGAGGWISWGNVQGLAAFRIAGAYPIARDYLGRALQEYQSNSEKNPFAYPFKRYPWGSLHLQTGVGILAACYQIAGGDNDFRELAVRQRDALFGANPFGVSYFSGVGTRYAKHFHNQVSYLKKIALPGGIAEGPIARKEFSNSNIQLEFPDAFTEIQTELAVYHDDPKDYLTNEPTIAGNAQAFFLLSWFASEAKYHRK